MGSNPVRSLVLAGIASATTAGLSQTTLADVELEDNIPIELARALLRSGHSMPVRFYADIPDHFQTVALPQDAEVLGSVDQGHNQQVFLRVSGNGVPQRSRMIAALEEEDYLILTQAPVDPNQTGFVAPPIIPPGVPVQLCHDSRGMINIRLTSAPDTDDTTINLMMSAIGRGAGFSCAQMIEQTTGFHHRAGAASGLQLRSHLPRMELPVSATTPAQPHRMSMTSSNASTETRIEFQVDLPLEDLYRHFADQVGAQDWQTDAESIGTRTAQGLWLLDVDDHQLLGTLRLVSQGEESYLASFSISLLE